MQLAALLYTLIEAHLITHLITSKGDNDAGES